MTLTLASTAFTHGSPIPREYSCEGDDLSPPLSWSDAPAGTKSFALICDDPDAPAGTWHHWAAFNIPGDQTALPEGFATDAVVGSIHQAVTDFGRPGYGGPCPPRGHGTHHYHFRLFALSVPKLDLPLDSTCTDVAAAAKPHVLASAELMGTYSR
ncbi:MAG: YbhB/YbcL family Raf kinase inhibitor-like protein [Alphaproteobacteria bacterium]